MNNLDERDLREAYNEAVIRDLMGPSEENESLSLSRGARVRDQYPFGLLQPVVLLKNSGDTDDEQDLSPSSLDATDPGDAISLASKRGPSSMGISFALDVELNSNPTILLEVSGGYYNRHAQGLGETVQWNRRALRVNQSCTLPLDRDSVDLPVENEDLSWHIRIIRHGRSWQITVVISNTWDGARSSIARDEVEQHVLFQSHVRVTAVDRCTLSPRLPSRAALRSQDVDTQTNALLYRHDEEWAVGHNCSAHWKQGDNSSVDFVETTWFPQQVVPAMDAGGDESLACLGDVFRASFLANAPRQQLTEVLDALPEAYLEWLSNESAKGSELKSKLRDTLSRHVSQARDVVDRMRRGIELIRKNDNVAEAFKFSQKSMLLQTRWAKGDSTAELTWRPFQLAFILLTLSGIADPDGHRQDRDLMDLLWFPTGGGKTEAYLGLAAFNVFLRRIEGRGAGVTVLMRYTLRLLTIQQFERASRMILACEYYRQRDFALLGEEPMSIGLWVGSASTPNNLKEARGGSASNVKQLVSCPVCLEDSLIWDTKPGLKKDMIVICDHKNCDMYGCTLPIYTVDEVIHAKKSTLLIGTVDKFAQLVRKSETASLCGSGGMSPPNSLSRMNSTLSRVHLAQWLVYTNQRLIVFVLKEVCGLKLLEVLRRFEEQTLRFVRFLIAKFASFHLLCSMPPIPALHV